MNAYMTTGTYTFLKQIAEKYPEHDFSYMKNVHSTLIYYEAKQKKGVFVSGKSYDILFSEKDINEKGYVVMNHLPISSDSMKVFEQQMLDILKQFAMIPGLIAVRFLKEKKLHHYIVLTQWISQKYYDDWLNSDIYQITDFSKTGRYSSYVLEQPFTNEYYMIEED